MPKIVRFYKTGEPENLQLEDAPVQQPGPGEVRLRVQAVGLNRAELLYLQGLYLEPTSPPSRIGYEAAGAVEAIGEGVDQHWIGKNVATIPGFLMSKYGVLGEEAVVPAAVLGEYPAKLSPTEAAAIWMQYLTAYGALVTFGKIQKDDFVVVSAASSSVGLAAIQIAKAEGATAIATTRTGQKRKELMTLGADHVVALDSEDLSARVKEISGGKGARICFDPVAGPFVEKLADAAAPGGMIFEYGALSMAPTPFPLMLALRKALTIRGYTLHELTARPEILRTAKQYVFDRLQDGRFVPKIAKTFPLEKAADAYSFMESNAQVGKIVITV